MTEHLATEPRSATPVGDSPGSVADVLAEELRAAGVERIYGMPGGGSNMTLIAAAAARGIEFVLAHEEPAAVFMAAGEAEVTGRPCVCLATLGPGVANSVNGLAHCRLDRVPVVLISDAPDDRAYGHQRIDHGLLVQAAVKRSSTVEPATAADTIASALALSASAPAGPVHLDLTPKTAAAEPETTGPRLVEPSEADPPDETSLADATRVIADSFRPVILAGLGARSDACADALRGLAEHGRIPVLTTYKAKGVLPESHPLAAGLVTNGRLEGRVLDDADALVTVGLDPVELMPGPWRWRLPTVSLASYPHDAHIPPSVELHGELGATLDALREELRRAGWRSAWSDVPTAWLRAEELASGRLSGVAPVDVVRTARRLSPGGTIATVDAGSHMFAATLFWRTDRARRFLISNGLSTMGYALPAAIGAAAASPDDAVVCFTGDGGLAMVAGELETLARLSYRVVVVVFDDRTLNLIKIKQERLGRSTHGLDFGGVDWTTVARGMGIAAHSVGTLAELESAYSEAIGSSGPTLLDVHLDPTTYPAMLAAIRG